MSFGCYVKSPVCHAHYMLGMFWVVFRVSCRHGDNICRVNATSITETFCFSKPILPIWINSNPIWVRNHMLNKMWDEITYPFLNFSRCRPCSISKIKKMNWRIFPSIAKFIDPIWGPSGSCRLQMGPMLATWTLLLGSTLRDKRQAQPACLI